MLDFVDWIYKDTDGKYFIKEEKGNETMKESKFKVGDKVIIKDGSKIKNYEGGWIKDMGYYIGRKCTISRVCLYNACKDTYAYRLKEIDYTWDERGLEPAENTIVISIKGKEIEAKFDGVCGIAKCNPEDDFDLKTGVVLAIDRLFLNMNRIKEGDSVIVTDQGQCYTTYTTWVTKNIKDKELVAQYKYGESIKKGDKFSVVKIAKHGVYDEELAFISNITGCYLIGLKGIKKHESN